MSPSLESGVQDRMENPSEGKEVALLIKMAEASESTVEEIEATGARVEERLELSYLAVSTVEERLGALCELDTVARIEIESEGSVMDSDFRTLAGPVL